MFNLQPSTAGHGTSTTGSAVDGTLLQVVLRVVQHGIDRDAVGYISFGAQAQRASRPETSARNRLNKLLPRCHGMWRHLADRQEGPRQGKLRAFREGACLDYRCQ